MNDAKKEFRADLTQAFNERKRVVILGCRGSGRYRRLLQSLSGISRVVAIDLEGCTSREILSQRVETTLPRGYGWKMAPEIWNEDAKSQPLSLIFRNVDYLAKGAEGAVLVGELREILERVSEAAVFFTAEDLEFVFDTFGSPEGAFYRQAAIWPLSEIAALNS